jgi:hypothetical protein
MNSDRFSDGDDSDKSRSRDMYNRMREWYGLSVFKDYLGTPSGAFLQMDTTGFGQTEESILGCPGM